MTFMIETYLECLAYMFPVILAYILSNNIKLTLFVLAIMILVRGGVALYYVQKSAQQPESVLKYSHCYKGRYIDEI